MSTDHFTLHQKERGKAYQACFCLFSETKWWGTGETNERKAKQAAKKVQSQFLNELALQAALKGKETPGYDTKTPEEPKHDEDSAWKAPPLDERKPAPKGSFREQIEAEVDFVQKNKESDTRKREATDSQKHLYSVFGEYVDLPIKKFDGAMGDHLAAFYNDPVRFYLCSENYATIMRRFLQPMVDRGQLSREFFTALEKVKRQSYDSDASDPLMGDHYRRIDERLGSRLEPDYLLGLHLIGCHPAPQLRDAVLLRWEGVDFKSGLIKLFRGKTHVIAIFKMSKALRKWLWRRRQQASPDDVYVFWELACKKGDRDKPDFNQTLEAEDRAGSISSNVAQLWRSFLHRAGVPVGLMKFVEGDIIDLKGFIEKLRSKAEPKYEWLFNRCKGNCKKALLNGIATEEDLKKLEKLLRTNLNGIVVGDFAFDSDLIPEEKLRGQTREFSNKDYKGTRLYTFHRLLLEDLFPELRHVEFTNYNYSYSSYRKALVSFLRGISFRDPVIARILGQDSLESQNDYDRVAEHELQRGCDLTESHINAMIQGKTEFYPSIPYDFFEKMMEQFGVQDQARVELLTEFRRLLSEAEDRALARHQELKDVVKHGGQETQSNITATLEAIQGRNDIRMVEFDARLKALEEMGHQLLDMLPLNTTVGTRVPVLAFIRLFLLFLAWLASGNAPFPRHQSFVPRLPELGPPRNRDKSDRDHQNGYDDASL